jgi:hypothetical protein
MWFSLVLWCCAAMHMCRCACDTGAVVRGYRLRLLQETGYTWCVWFSAVMAKAPQCQEQLVGWHAVPTPASRSILIASCFCACAAAPVLQVTHGVSHLPAGSPHCILQLCLCCRVSAAELLLLPLRCSCLTAGHARCEPPDMRRLPARTRRADASHCSLLHRCVSVVHAG